MFSEQEEEVLIEPKKRNSSRFFLVNTKKNHNELKYLIKTLSTVSTV